MSFLRYPAYKDSGVEWLGEVPEHWDVKPVLAVARERDEDNKGMKEDNLLSLSYGSIVNKDINTSDGLLPESFETYQIISPGDIVLRLTDLHNDKRSLRSALATQRGIITSAYLALQPQGIESRYLSYLLRAYDVSKVFYSMGGGLRQSMKFSDVKRMPVVLPGKTEQVAISRFLDRETSKIDALIAEQQCLIELLQEKRQAVISQAVTKGLNPEAPMKDSGVEWLGEVPEHWRVLRGNYVGSVFGSEQIPEEKVNQEGDIPFIKVSTLSENCFEPLEPVWFVARADIRAGRGRKGFLVFPKRGAAIFGNKVNIIKVESLIDPNLMGWLISDNGAPAFYAYTLKSKKLEEIADVSTVPQINTKHIAQELWPCPPLIEQFEIIAFLDDQAAMFDSLVKETNSSIALLQERRSALISAAVTGQIDVRGLAPETSAA
jgi:type I restriction enzyme S subunit